MDAELQQVSRTSRVRSIVLAAVAAMAVTVGLMLALRMKDAPSPNAGKAPQTEAGRPSATEIAADRRHEAMALQAELQKKPTHVPILFRLAQLARESGKPAEAIPHLRKILDLEPKNTEARLELGRDLYDTGNVTDALKETNQILIENPKNPDALYNMGAIYANSSQPDAARQYWRRAVASDPASDSGKRAAESLPRLSGSHK